MQEQNKARVDVWKKAGPALEAIRDEELRQKGHKGVRDAGGVTVYEPHPHHNGMVTMQAWFMRQRLLIACRDNQASNQESKDR